MPDAGGGWLGQLLGTDPKAKVFEVLKHEVQHAADASAEHLAEVAGESARAQTTAAAFERAIAALRAQGVPDPRDLSMLPAHVSEAIRRMCIAVRLGATATLATGDATVRAYAEALLAERAQMGGTLALITYKTEYRAYSYDGKLQALRQLVALHRALLGGHGVPWDMDGAAMGDLQEGLQRQTARRSPGASARR